MNIFPDLLPFSLSSAVVAMAVLLIGAVVSFILDATGKLTTQVATYGVRWALGFTLLGIPAALGVLVNDFRKSSRSTFWSLLGAVIIGVAQGSWLFSDAIKAEDGRVAKMELIKKQCVASGGKTLISDRKIYCIQKGYEVVKP